MELLLDAESQIETWQEVILVYNAALKQINTKLEILNDEFQHVHQYLFPIQQSPSWKALHDTAPYQ